MIPQLFIKTFASVFYLGYFPYIPGTLGSLAGMILYLLVYDKFGVYLVITAVLFIIGLFISHPAENIFGERDSRKIVIDEASGMLVTFLFIPWHHHPLVNLFQLSFGFLLFRFFDILKPPPLKRLQSLPNGFGVMMDDLGAAVYSNIILRLLCVHLLR